MKVNDVEGLRTALSNIANDLWGLQVLRMEAQVVNGFVCRTEGVSRRMRLSLMSGQGGIEVLMLI